jgi:hypothetical protein
MSKDQGKFIKDWKKYYTKIFLTMYPGIDKEELNKLLDKIIDEKLVNPPAQLHNNYIHKSIQVDLLGIYDWIDKTQPIVAGFGVFFKNQNQVLNPAAVMLDNFLNLRKSYKKELKNYLETSYEYATFDRLQATEKINANSYYGASGAPTSNFFNLYTATSVTATGQSLISTTETAFEAFLANNIPFSDLDECMTFLNNIVKEKRELDDDFLPDVPIELVMKRLNSMFNEYKNEYTQIIFNYLINLSQKDLNRIYFKNNIFGFSKISKIRNKLTDIIMRTESFKDPNKVPENIVNSMDDLWDYYKEFVLYNYPAFNRIQRLKTEKRKRVVTVDTDSNMINLNPWVEFLYYYIISDNDVLLSRNPDELRYISINIMCYVLTHMITEVLWKYTKTSNILKEFRSRINMKNEFLFSRMILAASKKRYITGVKLREGKEIIPEKIEIKGMDFVKSTTRDETRKYFINLVKEKILYVDKINISEILRELERFEGIIRDSLLKGEKHFLIPKSVKELEAYKDAFKEQGVRGIIAWNYLYPSQIINLPEKIDMVKVKLTNEKEVEKLKDVNKEYYDIIMKNIFGNKEPKISEKGVQVIAIPRNVDAIPEWIVPFIDYDTIVNDNISRFYSVLESLGLENIRTSKKEYFSNILTV